MQKLLGRYENFPDNIHGIASLTYWPSRRQIQQTILHTFHQLNQEVCSLNEIAPPSTSKWEVSFELGVAEGITFNYLDREEVSRVEKSIAKRALPVLDFLCVARYRIMGKGKREVPKSDYHLLRLAFYRKNAELRGFHERGPRRVSPKDLLVFMLNRINASLLRNRLKPLTIGRLRAL